MIIEELKHLFRKNGIPAGSIICVHSDVTSFGIPKKLKEQVKIKGIYFLMDSYIDTFKSIVGDNGLILMPTFTYSATKNEVYSVQDSKSTVGALTEYFRKKEGVYRSLHPIFSYAAWGKDAKEFIELENYDCYGEQSFFGKLFNLNVFYVLFGVDFQHGATFVYYSEEKAHVYYRYYKMFTGIIKNRNQTFEKEIKYYVRNYDISYEDYWYDMEKKAQDLGIARKFEYSGGDIYITKSREIDELIQKELKKDEDFLIKK